MKVSSFSVILVNGVNGMTEVAMPKLHLLFHGFLSCPTIP